MDGIQVSIGSESACLSRRREYRDAFGGVDVKTWDVDPSDGQEREWAGGGRT